jgi:hypothetical protein
MPKEGDTMNNDACTRIKLRMAWCQSQSAQARTEPELEGWRAEEAGLHDAILKQDRADHYRLSPPEIFDRYVLGFQDGTAMLCATRVERHDSSYHPQHVPPLSLI